MATLVIYVILKDVFNLDKRIGRKNFFELEVTLNGVLEGRNEIDTILNTITQKKYKILNTSINAEDKSNVKIHVTISLLPNIVSNEILADLLQHEYVKKVNMF